MSLTTTIRLQALDATWETLGVGRYRGIVPEQVQESSNLWGPDSLSASLRIVEPSALRPDLGPFTPIEVEEDGQVVWAGRIIDSSNDGEMLGIQAQGWQYHLDDDAYQASYVHTRLSDWRDVREVTDINLATYTTAYEAAAGGGVIKLGVPNNATVSASTGASVYLDFGPDARAQRIVLTYIAGAHASFDLYVRAGPVPGSGDLYLIDAGPITGATTTAAQTFTTTYRYVELLMSYNGAGGTIAADTAWVSFSSVQVFVSTVYESGNASVVKAVNVAHDSRLKSPLLSQTSTLLTGGGSFNIPHLSDPSYRTPREHAQGANAYEDDILKIGGSDLRTLVMKEKPTTPLYEVGNWSGSQFTDGGNSGDTIYNRVIVQGTGPAGDSLIISRSSSDAANPLIQVSAAHVATNPSFATNTTSWTAGTSTITRDTGVFDTTPASGRWDNTGASDNLGTSDYLEETFTGSYAVGVPYTVRFRIRATIPAGISSPSLSLWFGDIPAGNYSAATLEYGALTTATWRTLTTIWTPTTTTTTCRLRLTVGGKGGVYFHVDSVDVLLNQTTVIDRRRFVRTAILPISAPLTAAVGERLGDLWLAAHRTPSFRGSVTITPGGLRRVIGGSETHPSVLLRECGELMRFAHRTTPEDGSLGRDGRIVAVSYDAGAQSATVSIDNERRSFETLLERYGGVVGNVLQ